jgi:hypothetical protein
MLVVEDERSAVVGVEDNCALVVEVVAPVTVADVDVVVDAVAVVIPAIVDAVVAPMAVADVDVVMVAAAAVVDALVVPVVGELAAVQLATGRLVQEHRD